jgi:AraC-like DNA-binding protein
MGEEINFIPVGKRYKNLEVLFVGVERCESEHSFGPHIRDYTIIHYVKSGEGMLYDKYGAHRVCAGEIFIMRSGEVTTYVADREHPWHYVWIAMRGVEDEEFLSLPSVLPYPRATFSAIEEGLHEKYDYPFFLGRACSLLFHLFEKKRTRPAPEILLHEHIELQYMQPFSMSAMAQRYGFDRSYLGRCFKERYHLSPREYLMDVRISHAKDFLQGDYSIGACGAMCGYPDTFCFSKIFKSKVGVTPSEYRKKSQNDKTMSN